MVSIWSKTAEKPRFDQLTEDIKTDVLIIGGGMTGILCAYMLKQSGVDCVVAEAGEICGVTTKNTTAKITFQHGLLYDQMIHRFGIEMAKGYLQAQKAAMQKFHSLAESIPCDFEERDSFVYSLNDREKLEKEAKALAMLGYSPIFRENLPLPLSIVGAVGVKAQAQFHPLKFAFSLAKKLPIYENTRITELTPDGALTPHGKIKAEKIIVATHFPFLNKHGTYFIKMHQHRSYVMAFENIPDVNGMYVDESQKGLSFRTANGLLLLGGGGHRTGANGGNWQEILGFAHEHYPSATEVAHWAAQDCMTLDDIPYIGRYSKRTPNLYVATGFNKWGMTSSMVSAMILSDLVQGKTNDYAEIFSPSRSMLRPQIAANIAHSVIGLLTPTVPRCPHLGCALKYNRAEHSWDCPCHGSRFSETGKVLENPANGDKQGLKKKSIK